VARKPDPADRRAYRVELTARGRTTLVRATGAMAAAERGLMAPLTPTEQQTLRDLLQRLSGPASSAPSGPAEPAPEGESGPDEPS
jgi:DNA-binding MarR family transcriptional regulator